MLLHQILVVLYLVIINIALSSPELMHNSTGAGDITEKNYGVISEKYQRNLSLGIETQSLGSETRGTKKGGFRVPFLKHFTASQELFLDVLSGWGASTSPKIVEI